MRARRPQFDFSQTPAHWAQIPEFAQFVNASSAPIPHLERFLNRVMASAASKLKGDDEKSRKLREDIRVFIRQEANHYAAHDSFNRIMNRGPYDISGFEAFFEREYQRLYETESFAFCLAYCEGFETLGPPFARLWLDELDDLLVGADPQVVALWKWHLMEEYEHRTVCYDAFKALHGGYFMRIKGFFYQMKHLGMMTRMVREHLAERDMSGMTPEEQEASRRRARLVEKRIRGNVLRRVARALSPWYSPRRAPEPRMFKSYRDQLDAGLASSS